MAHLSNKYADLSSAYWLPGTATDGILSSLIKSLLAIESKETSAYMCYNSPQLFLAQDLEVHDCVCSKENIFFSL